MGVFNPNTVDFTKEEINDISAAIYERTYANPMLADYFVINSGVKKDQQIAILGADANKIRERFWRL
jgi:hypothetical protein